MLNEVTLMGRLTRDPELRRTGNGTPVTSFRIAVERDIKPKDAEKPETDFVECVAWRGTAEFIEKYFSKGRMIVVHGSLRQRGYTTKEGEKRQVLEVEVENVYFGDSKRSESSEPAGDYQNAPYSAPQSAPSSDFAMMDDDDGQLPF